MTRSEFLKTAGSAAILAAAGDSFGQGDVAVPAGYAALQSEIDEVTPQDFGAYLVGERDASGRARKAALRRLDEAFDKVLKEVRETVVTDKPAIWLVYNMGVIVKTRETCFSIDLKHRRAPEIAPLLDFALITHNHGDHYTEELYRAMNGVGKTVISNFKDNYGAADWRKGGKYWEAGGYTRAEKTFKLKDVEIRTALTDHNPYLVDFTTAFEVHVGKYTIYHSGDCSNVAKLNPTRRPDLWIVHPYCGTKVEIGVEKMKPRLTVMAHLNEFGHARNRWRWTWEDGFKAEAKAEAAGGKAIVPTWGARLV